jgi:hypothetical protein
MRSAEIVNALAAKSISAHLAPITSSVLAAVRTVNCKASGERYERRPTRLAVVALRAYWDDVDIRDLAYIE